MAMTADSSSNHHSPRGGAAGGDGVINSPRVRRKNLPSPWAQVVRGELEPPPAVNQPPSPPSQSSPPPPLQLTLDTETPCSPPPPVVEGLHAAGEGSDRNSSNAVSATPKKPAWNKPSIVDAPIDASPVMGDAVSWPALSESARGSPKLPTVDPSPPPPGSISGPQARPAVVHSPKKPSAATNNVNPSSTPNHTNPARPKPKRGGGSGSNSNSGGGNNSSAGEFSQSGFTNSSPPAPPPPPPYPILVGPNAYGNFMPPPSIMDPSMSHPYKGNTWEPRPGFTHQPHTMNDHRNSSRRGNFGSHPRGDGPSHSGGYGGRRDQDRGNYGGGRDSMPPQRANPRGGFVRSQHPPPNSVSFFPPQAVRPYGPMPFPEFYHPAMAMESPYRGGAPFFPNVPPVQMFMPVAENPLHLSIIRQIDYYFSDDNLVKDDYLKRNMDMEGWVPIGLIASFPRVKNLTSNIQLILDALKSSTIVEVLDDKVRRRNEWKKFLRPPSQTSESGSPSSVGSGYNALATSFQKMTVEETPVTPSQPGSATEDNHQGQR